MNKLHLVKSLYLGLDSFMMGLWGVYVLKNIIPHLSEEWLATMGMVTSTTVFILLTLTANKRVRKWLTANAFLIAISMDILEITAISMGNTHVKVYYILMTIYMIMYRTLYDTIWADKLQIIFKDDERFFRSRLVKIVQTISGVIAGSCVVLFKPEFSTVVSVIMVIVGVKSCINIYDLVINNKYIRDNNLVYGFGK